MTILRADNSRGRAVTGPGRLTIVLLLLRRLVPNGPRRHVLTVVAALIVLVLGGGVVFALSQGYAIGTGIYWAVTTATTVGYGDVTPHNGWGRLIASVVMLTTIPLLGVLFALVTGAAVSRGIRRIMGMTHEFPSGSYRLIVGMHPTVPAILHELSTAKDAIVLVANTDPENTPSQVHVIKGDPTDPAVLARAKPAGACHVLVTGQSDGDVLVTTVLLRTLAPDVPVTALAGSSAVRDALTDLGVAQTLSVNDLVAHTLAKSLEVPHAGGLLHELLDSDDCSLTEIEVDASAVGAPLSAVRAGRDGLVLGLVHDGSVELGLTGDPVVSAGDHLLVAVATTAGAPTGRSRPGR